MAQPRTCSNDPASAPSASDPGMRGANSIGSHSLRHDRRVRKVGWERPPLPCLLTPHCPQASARDLPGQCHARQLAPLGGERNASDGRHGIAAHTRRLVHRETDAHDQLLTDREIETHLPPGRSTVVVTPVLGAHAPGFDSVLVACGECGRDTDCLPRSARSPEARNGDEPFAVHPASDAASSISVRTPYPVPPLST